MRESAAASHPATHGVTRAAPRAPKAAELLAAQIRAQIVRGELVDGAWLPPEAEMIARWKVGRPAVREALRILESESLIKVQRGNVGGARIQLPSVSAVVRSAAMILQVEKTSLRDIYEARLTVETDAADRAARAVSDDTVARLQELLDLEQSCVEDAAQWASAAVHFHEGVVRAAGVRTLVLFSDMISELIDEHQVSAATVPSHNSASERRQASRAHAKLLSFVKAGDSEGARRHWRAHLERTNVRYFDEGD